MIKRKTVEIHKMQLTVSNNCVSPNIDLTVADKFEMDENKIIGIQIIIFQFKIEIHLHTCTCD